MRSLIREIGPLRDGWLYAVKVRPSPRGPCGESDIVVFARRLRSHRRRQDLPISKRWHAHTPRSFLRAKTSPRTHRTSVRAPIAPPAATGSGGNRANNAPSLRGPQRERSAIAHHRRETRDCGAGD